ncbi:MAG: hypothetical protein JO041_02115 [Acidobacteria bacterium]|nr:hypothetical protein [Acidobacteriota bacterium]
MLLLAPTGCWQFRQVLRISRLPFPTPLRSNCFAIPASADYLLSFFLDDKSSSGGYSP